MNPVVQTVLTVVIAVVLFMLVILIHELGHFSFAKLFKVRVNEFAIGMGPRLFGWRKGETDYSVRLIPIGGYCAMEGEDEDSSDERAFNRAKVWKRIIIVVAGAVFNIILGFIFMVIIQGQQDLYASNTITGFYPSAVSASDYTEALAQDSDKVFYCYLEHFDRTTKEQSVERFELVKNEGDETITDLEGITWEQLLAQGYEPGVMQTGDKGTNCHILRQATSSYTGLRYGDTIWSVNGSRALCFNDAYFEMAIDQDNTVDMVVIRDGQKVELKGVTFDRSEQGYSVLDFTVDPIERTFGTMVSQTFLESQYMIRSVYKSLFMLITGRVPVSEMSGPIGIASAIGEEFPHVDKGDLLQTYGPNTHLNGRQTLAYARVRNVDSDFSRAERQRNVLVKLMEKLKGKNAIEIVSMANTFSGDVKTNMDLNRIIEIAITVLNSGLSDVETFRIPMNKTYTEERRNDQAMLYDCDWATNSRELYSFIYS